MKFVADLHLHSHFSRATSKNLNFEHLSKWAQLKGVNVVGTGDIAHPGWLQEMRAKLEPAEEGLFRLKADYARAVQEEVPAACHGPVRFMLAGEISSIYKKNDKVRKIHNVIFAPSLEIVEKIQAALEKIGNIRADGRPILGLDSRDLLEIILDIDPQNYLIPAHIWTPWFSLLGSKSGFDSVEECFADLTSHIFALETGLSSDPPMNWRVSALDGYTLVSNSDAHSPPKLAREANLFDTELSYPAIFAALKRGGPVAFLGTIEFFPEEGKYHSDGHRKCGICWDPRTTLAHQGLCAVCGKPVTVGVDHRVEMLADRAVGEKPARTQPFRSLIPLPEILAEVYEVGPNSKRVPQEYEALLSQLGAELFILQDALLADIQQVGGALLAEGIRRVREGEVNIAAGYDGEYGVIKLFEATERKTFSSQLSLFAPEAKKLQDSSALTSSRRAVMRSEARPRAELVAARGRAGSSFSSAVACRQTREHSSENSASSLPVICSPGIDKSLACYAQDRDAKRAIPFEQKLWGYLRRDVLLTALNPEQQAAVRCTDVPLIIVAGPGTGKTRTLTYRIAYLITEKGVAPEQILAITFTNKAAEEMTHRLTDLLGEQMVPRMVIKTFHAFGAMILREAASHLGLSPNFSICSGQDQHTLLKQSHPTLSEKERNRYLEQISAAKNCLLEVEDWTIGEVEGWRAGGSVLSAVEGVEGLPTLVSELREDSQFVDIYRSYEAALRQNQALDFDDLIGKTVQLFETSPDLLKFYQDRFRWISVDEYQDLNLAQYRLLRLLTGPATNLCVIGDPDQAIYGFRGADRSYFLSFNADFPAAETHHLRQNYRSTALILEAAAQVIAKNPDRTALEIWSEFVDKTRLEVYYAPTAKAEAEVVVQQIEQMVGGTSYFSLDSGRVADDGIGRTFADFAVLYRVGAQSLDLMEAFDRSGIPYQTIGQKSLYEYPEIRQMLAYLRFIANPDALLYLEQILNFKTSRFSPPLLEELVWLAGQQQQALWTTLQTFETVALFQKAHKKQLREIVPFLQDLQQSLQTQPLSRSLEAVYHFMVAQVGVTFAEKQIERFQQLILRASLFASRLHEFLESTALLKETDAYDPRADRVTLLTLHAAKGLEFPVVFIVGCEEGLLPYQPQDEAVDVAEERRLFYVGMTRAQQRLILTHPKSRFLFGQQLNNPPSRFLADIEQTLTEIKKSSQQKSRKEIPGNLQLKLF